MAEETQEGSSVTGRRRPGKTRHNRDNSFTNYTNVRVNNILLTVIFVSGRKGTSNFLDTAGNHRTQTNRAVFAHQAEGVVCVHELLYGVLLQHHHVGQVGATLTCAVLTVNHICLPAVVLTCHKQQIEHLHL